MVLLVASASLRDKPGYAHFAVAKAGPRVIAQSMAPEYGPRDLHVARVAIGGGIDCAATITMRGQRQSG